VALRTVGVRLQAEVSGYVNSLKTAQRATRDFVQDLDRAAREGHLDAVADQAGRMGLAMTAAAGLVVTAAARFDQAMSSVQAATLASAGEMELLRQAAIDAGRDTAYSATEAAAAIEELAKAGVSTADILGGGLRGALALAAAGQIDVAEAAETAASAMTQFGLAGRDVGHVADLLAAAAGKAQGSVGDLRYALSQAGLVAAQMGLSIEDTVGTLAAFASAGLMGSDAGTSLKTALLMLANPTDQARRLMQELGIRVYDASGRFVGIVELAGQLQSQLGKLSQEQRNAALATIFGSDAIRAASILYEQGADGIRRWIDAVNEQGFAAETARAKTDNLIGDIERLTGELETLAITSGSGVNEGLRTLVQGLERIVASLGALPGPIQTGAVLIAGLGGAALLATAGWIRLRRTTGEALKELREVGPAGRRAADALQRVGRAAGRAGVAIAGLQIASAALGNSLAPQIDVLAERISEFAASGETGGEVARLFGDDLGKLDRALKDIGNTGVWWSITRGIGDTIEGLTGLGNVFDDSLQKSRERLRALDEALAHLVQSGRAKEAAEAFDAIAKRAAEQGVSIKELRDILPGYVAAIEMAARESGKAADAVGEVGEEAAIAAQNVQALKDAFDRLFDAQMSYDRAVIAVKQGLADLKKELLDGTRTLSINTEEGRKNRSAVLDQIQAIKDLRQARIDHGMALDEANKLYVKDIEGLRNVMLQAGYTKKEIDALIDAYRQIPEMAQTEVSAPGAKESEKKVRDYNFEISKVPDSKKTKITVDTGEAMERARDLANYLRNAFNFAMSPLAAVATIGRQYRRWGGIDYHMARGGAIEAHFATAPTILYGERETGGEAFIPRLGDRERSLSILGVAASWYGMRLTPMTDTQPQMADVRWHQMPATRATPSQRPESIIYDNRITIQPLKAEITMRDIEAYEARRDALMRVGRPR